MKIFTRCILRVQAMVQDKQSKNDGRSGLARQHIDINLGKRN
jgi:hypothetical protein